MGRELERSALKDVWSLALGGMRQLVFLTGEPGIGKSRLAAEVAAGIHASGAAVLYGHCDEALGISYQPFAEALQTFVRGCPDGDLRAALGRHGGDLVRLVPELGERLPDLAPPLHSDLDTERYRLLDAIVAWLTTVSQPSGAVLVVDDLHEAAMPTLVLLRHVLRSATAARLLILATARDAPAPFGSPTLEVVPDLLRMHGVHRVELGGLDTEDIAELVMNMSGRELGASAHELAGTIRAETDGNAFLATELLRHVVDGGALPSESPPSPRTPPLDSAAEPGGDAGGNGVAVPATVRDVVRGRVARLSEAGRSLLLVASVAGRDFDVAVVREAGAMDDDLVMAALDEASGARLVTETGPNAYRFSHSLVHATLYHELSATRRSRAHRRIAEATLRVRPEDTVALAHHYRLAMPTGTRAEAVAWAQRAGDAAMEGLAPSDAAAWYRQALDLGGDAERDSAPRCELLLSMGRAQRLAGDRAYRETLLESARMAQRLGLAAPLIAAALANSRGFYSAAGTVDTERVAVLEAALAAVGDGDSADRARILGVLAAELVFTGDAERWQGICDEALDMARRLGDPATVMDILAASWTVIWDPKHLDTRLQRSAEHMELAAQSGDPRQIVVAGLQRFGAALDAGDVDDADRALAIAAAASDGVSDPTLRWQTAVHRTKRLLLAGRTAEAEVAAQAAYDLGRSTGQPDAGAWDAVHLYGIRLDQGRLGELRESVVQIGSAYPMVWYWQIGLAMIDCELEHPERDTTSILARLASDDFRDVRFDLFWLFEMAQLAEISWHRRDAASARAIYERIQPYAAQLVSVRPLCIGAVERYLGLAAVTFDDLPAAGAHFAAACALHERIGAPTWLARTQLDWARMLLRRGGAGDVERAREMLSTVRDAARKLGLAAVDQHAAALLAAG